MFFVQMFDEVPRKHPYLRDPTGTKQIRNYKHMLQVLNHIVTRAPEWTEAAENVGVVGVPMCAIFDYPMGTPRYAYLLLFLGSEDGFPNNANEQVVDMPRFWIQMSTRL